MRLISMTAAAVLCAVPTVVYGQFNFRLAERDIQIHSFVSQGFAFSSQNNYLTMKTSDGSFAMTDGGVNVGVSLTDRLRVGAQMYLRNVGDLGQWRPELDWAYADYRVRDWFGVRGGKVKTALGLHNDTQDAEALHTWAILPQSVYPLDLRSNTIAHVGGDVYGEINLRQFGKLGYTGYVGARTFDSRGGYYYFSEDQGIPIKSISGRVAGGDLRWSTPLQGLLVGASFMDQTQNREGSYGAAMAMFAGLSYRFVSNPQHTVALYADFSRSRWHFNAELRKSNYLADITTQGMPGGFVWDGSDKGWFASAAYRVTNWLELGTYHSRYYMGHPWDPANAAANHIYDQTVTARFDPTRHWNFKVEGHFMDGNGDVYSAHGFYARSNPGGLKPKTNMLVFRTGFTF